jgi:uncharacterized protein Usg
VVGCMEGQMQDLRRMMLENYRLTTAEILYRLPDHPSLLQSYVWQELDITPDFPVLKKFLHFWERELDGKIHSVQVASCTIITPSQWHVHSGQFTIH